MSTDGNYLERLMAEKGIKGFSELAKRCNANRMTLYNIFHYGREPSYKVMKQVKEGLELDEKETGRLFFGEKSTSGDES